MSDGERSRVEVLRDLGQKRLTTEATAQLRGVGRCGLVAASGIVRQKFPYRLLNQELIRRTESKTAANFS
jgi:hypothetical protein